MKYVLICALVLKGLLGFSQQPVVDNIVVIVLDGMRWQEVFGGVDTVLLHNTAFTKEKKIILDKYDDKNPELSRVKLMPFLWNTVAKNGQIYGNRKFGNYVNVANPFQMTYPGFSEMLTGYVDMAINSNKLVTSKSDNILEFLAKQEKFKNQIAVFATSDLFPFLLDKPNSQLYINSDSDTLDIRSEKAALINKMQKFIAKPTTERPDILTYFSALEYIREKYPKVIYLAFGETDAFGHAGNYDQYLETAHVEDKMIENLWNELQTMTQYKDRTTLLITCDHGRGGKNPLEWTDHGAKILDSGQIWLAAMGPNIHKRGEVQEQMQLYQAQIAATIGAILGFDYAPLKHTAFDQIKEILK